MFLLAVVVAITASVSAIHAEQPPAEADQHAAVTPSPRIVDWWFARQAEKIGRMSKGDIELLMVGDSITHNF